ncbi:TPA: hypothetical protein ACH3X1_003770 [Trebouxia sp. C0004]
MEQDCEDEQFKTQTGDAAETIEVIYLLIVSQAQCTNLSLSLSFYTRLPELQGLALTLTTLASYARVYTVELTENTFDRNLEERKTINECLSSAVVRLVEQVNVVAVEARASGPRTSTGPSTGVVDLAMAQVVADKLQSFIAQIRSTALHHICNTARVSQEHPTDTASAGVRELVVSQQLQLADLQANVDVTKTTVGSVLSCLDELRSDLRWKALLEGMKSLPGSEFSGASTQWSVSKYMTCLARKQWLHPSTISHIEAYLLNSTQAAVLQTEASASRAAQQLLADEDRAAAIAAAKKAKKKQRQKARNQLTRNELVSVEQAPVESTAAPAVTITSTHAAKERTQSKQLTDAHTSAAAAAAATVLWTCTAL